MVSATGEAGPDISVLSSEPRSAFWPIVVFVLRRVLVGCLTLLVASLLIFCSVQVLPGNVTQAVLGQQATPDRVALVDHELGLDQPLPQRYVTWLGRTLQGDFGNSTAAAVQGSTVPVWGDIRDPLLNTLVLAILAGIAFVLVSVGLGTWAALRNGRFSDRVLSSTALALGAIPEFVVATLLIAVFFSWLDVLPPISQVISGDSPLADPNKLVLPVLTLLASAGSYGIRLVRASVLEVLDQDYVSMARLNGVPERSVVTRFVLRNSIAANVQGLANVVRYLLAGIIIVESMFAYPGIGAKLVSAVSLRDYQEVATISFLLAAGFIMINLVADLLVVLLVPRLRTEEFS